MFTGYDDDNNDDDESLLNLIQSEAKSLVDSVLEDSVVVVYNNDYSSAPLNPSSSSSIQVVENNNLSEYYDEQPLSHEISNEDSSSGQQNVQLPLNHVHNSDEISDNFAIKSDYDLIAKSPTIESGMSGKDFEDVDDEYNLNIISTMNENDNNNCVVKVENASSSLEFVEIPHAQNNNLNVMKKNSDEHDGIQNEAQHLVDSVLKDTVTHIEDNQSSSSNIFNVQGDTYRHEHNK